MVGTQGLSLKEGLLGVGCTAASLVNLPEVSELTASEVILGLQADKLLPVSRTWVQQVKH